jgi:hypothetical protein
MREQTKRTGAIDAIRHGFVVLQCQADKEALSTAITDMANIVLRRPSKRGHRCWVRHPQNLIGIRAFALVIAIKRHEGRRSARAAL